MYPPVIIKIKKKFAIKKSFQVLNNKWNLQTHEQSSEFSLRRHKSIIIKDTRLAIVLNETPSNIC